MPPRTPSTRPGGRSSRVLAAIHASVGDLVAEGAGRIPFPVIAERAGVNPTTLYRRWPDVDALLEEVAVAALTRGPEAVPDRGSLERDLREWAVAIVEDITRPERTRYLRATVAARTEAEVVCPVWEDRREQVATMVERAADRGESAPTVEQVLDHVVAPLYHHVAYALPTDREHATRLVADVMLMARPE